jgi:hypothetical protein
VGRSQGGHQGAAHRGEGEADPPASRRGQARGRNRPAGRADQEEQNSPGGAWPEKKAAHVRPYFPANHSLTLSFTAFRSGGRGGGPGKAVRLRKPSLFLQLAPEPPQDVVKARPQDVVSEVQVVRDLP